MTHRPTIYWFYDAPPPSDRENALNLFARARKTLEESSPDVIVIVGSDHLDNFLPTDSPSFCIGISDRAEGPFPVERRLGIPRYGAPVDGELARFLLDEGLKSGIDFSRTSNYRLDHAFVVPLSFLSPEGRVPIVPVFANTLVPPIPSIQRFYALGEFLADAIERYPSKKRVALVGSFNFSTDVGGSRHGERSKEFDDKALELTRKGSYEDILSQFSLKEIFKAGNSASDFLHYVVVLGAARGAKPVLAECPVLPRWSACPVAIWQV